VALAANFNLQLGTIVRFKMLVTPMFLVQTQMKQMIPVTIVKKEKEAGNCSKIRKMMFLLYQNIARKHN
jgi:hypothetical protein